ncbi:MAG: class I SAM-dependent methyltransferase [Deltaproteobacteria bacterium]|nr:class I SAM-dependent methyltransferase [Deltaproteobacteria bacterium]MBI3390800.1 class I SAM-dependent methyltransferase [Deltaproteobacteria bacterium]
MPFAIYVPFYPGHEPNLIFSREGDITDYDAYLALADDAASAAVFDIEVPSDGPVIDAGCGGGRWLLRLHQRGRRMIGVDLFEPVLQQIHRQAPAVPLVRAVIATLPFRSASLAAVVSLGVVEHNEAGPDDALREFARVLRPGGRLLVSVPYDNLVRRFVVNHLYRRYNTPWAGRGYYFVEYRFQRHEILAALERSGFRPLSWHPHDLKPPRSVGLVADLNMLGIRFEQRDGALHLHVPPNRGWKLNGWRGWAARLLPRVSPWLTAAEILVVAEKAGGPA